MSIIKVLGKLGPGRLGPGKLGPSPIWRQIGPRTFWGPICHFLANRAPADWAPWRQIGPRQIGPRQIGPLGGKLGPGKLGPGRLGPLAADWAPANWAPADWAPWRQIGPRQIGPRQIGPLFYIHLYWIYSANNWENICQLTFYILVLDIFCQQLGDICHLEGVSAPFGSRVGEYAFSRICTFNLEYIRI